MPVHHARRGRNFQTYYWRKTVSATHSATTDSSNSPTSAVPICTTSSLCLFCCIRSAPYSSQSLAFLVSLLGITSTKWRHHYYKLSFTFRSSTSRTSKIWTSRDSLKWQSIDSFCFSRNRSAKPRKKRRRGSRKQHTARVQEFEDRATWPRLETWTSVLAGWSLTYPISTKTTSEISLIWNDVYSLH
jgi:hypothetical protein